MSSPLLLLQKKDGSVVEAKQEDFHRYTTKRWLGNDAEERSKRYRDFNLEALIAAATRSSRTNTKQCTQIMKYLEGQYSKTFLLTFDDKSEVVVKLPNPNAGPAIFTIASEVATMEFVRRIIGIPVPRVLDWSCDRFNSVGCEYIIMEKAKGVPLAKSWYRLPSSSKHNFIRQVVEMEAELASVPFPAHGCVYRKHDLPSEYSQNQISFDENNLHEFCIGPVIDPVFWSDCRSELQLSRGPWRDISHYARSLGENEKYWADRYAQPRINYYRSNTDAENPSEYLALIEKYLLVAPFITKLQVDSHDILQPTLWHSDLHLNNIYVDLETETITDIIDWQNTTTAPLIFQAKIPRMARHVSPLPLGWHMPEKPENHDDLPQDAKLKADELYQSALCHKYYEVVTAKKNPRHYAALLHNDGWKAPLVRPIKAIGGAWSSREVFGLRASLLEVVDHWPDLDTQIDCPISFTAEETDLHHEELENREYVEQLMEQFQEAGILPIDGVADPEDYEILQRTNIIQKSSFLSLAESEEEKMWMDKIWPYQDRPQDA
ncbi:uncharacterized protein DSM5745_08162 [Aspergillus mulundensis]|uniref:Altered inheritance of mitochondria protein 9, mitochondrial n=1 Tax=Aspergillus mulundensis TaxID=1810919 RepID=A0A3D8R9T9_9EURO|nr:Uncharacterized protein DSM5745_08162 [Aspergillus mulundensis]RDW70651.1 Uncharacterized protein DSM5745_08162 [Aspergillus mulundensis]